jgi:hypothetical protein
MSGLIFPEELSNPRWTVIERMRDILVAKFGSQADNPVVAVEVLQQLAATLTQRAEE